MSISSFDNPSLEIDPWLSDVFGYNVYRLHLPEPNCISSRAAKPNWLKFLNPLIERPIFVYTKVPAAAVAELASLERVGFHVIDVNVTFDKEIETGAPGDTEYKICFAEDLDADRVAELASNAFSFSRFHLDPAIDDSTANRVKAEWARNYFNRTRGDAMVVARDGERVIGFLQLLYRGLELVIDLVGVSPDCRRRGIAAAMIRFAERECVSPDEEGFTRVIVGTQLANIASLRLYEKLNFRICAAPYVLHYHNR